MATFQKFIRSIQQVGNDGKAFEVFCKWFLKIDPYWKTQVDHVWLWDDWPDKWGPDCGIDLVFQDKKGDTWAVQAKCYDEKYSVTKADMNSFLTESSRSVIQKRLLLSSTDKMGATAIRTSNQQEKPVVRFMLKDFESSSVDYPNNISERHKAKPKKAHNVRPYQREAVDTVVQKFSVNDRGQLIMACGTGKTFVTLWIKERLKSETTLVLLPSLSLLSQTLIEWTSNCNEAFDVLCVCSDTPL